MKREDAFYFKNMLMLGLFDGYDEWLNSHLESENPLSDITLELSCCGSNVNKIISVLQNYCLQQPIDEAVVCDKLRLFFKEAFYSNKMSKDEVVSKMYRLAQNAGGPDSFDMKLWGSMYYLSDYYSLSKDGILTWESFDSAFFSYLNDGTPINPETIWKYHKKPSFIDRVKHIFKR